MNLLLAEAGVGVSQWIMFGLLIAIIIIAPIFMNMRNKKEMAKAQQVMDSLKKGDKILTTAGVIGKVVGIEEKDGYKTVTIETGDEKHKGYMTMDINAIYMNLSAPENADTLTPKSEKVEESSVVEEEKIEETTEVVEKVEEPKVEEKTKKSTKKSSTKKSK